MLIIIKDCGKIALFLAHFDPKSGFFLDIAAVYEIKLSLFGAAHYVYLVTDHVFIGACDKDLRILHSRYKAHSSGLIELGEYIIQDEDWGR